VVVYASPVRGGSGVRGLGRCQICALPRQKRTGINPGEVMRPVFYSVWNAAGWPRSMNYDDAGNWGKGPNCTC
jgi:hypothetical protein